MEHDGKIKIENHFEAGSMTGCNVFTGTVNGGVFPLSGSQPTINNFFGGEKPQQPTATEVHAELEQAEEVQEETPEERAKRKERAMNKITALFDFDERVFCKDDNGNRITNERLSTLFRRCFGFGAHPSKEMMSVIDALWVLLIDKRIHCSKNPDEDFFRQTVLNVMGHYKKRGIISGSKSDLARSVFKDLKQGVDKNIDRGISPQAFPARTAELLDLYIDKLKKGEF